jgi:hypothetical protein
MGTWLPIMPSGYDVLDNITLFWLTNTGVSAARLYWEYNLSDKLSFFSPKGVKLPVAVSAFQSRCANSGGEPVLRLIRAGDHAEHPARCRRGPHR